MIPAQWPANQREHRPIAQLLPYARNPMNHSDEQVEELAQSIKHFGVTFAPLIDEQGVLIAGHGRVLAMQKLGLTETPVIVARGWSEDDKRAYRIADNQHARKATWNEDFLKSEVLDLKQHNFDLTLTGFDHLKIVEFVAGLGGGMGQREQDEETARERDLTDDEQQLLNEAWLPLLGEFRIMIETMDARGYLATSFTRGCVPVFFLRARYFGLDIPRCATYAYTPHRILINGDTAGSILDLLRLEMPTETGKDGMIKSVQWMCHNLPRFDRFINNTHPIHGHRIPGDFPALLARDLINEFCKTPGAKVLDPCHGWGGRLLGFLLSKNGWAYRGFDVDPKTSSGVAEMYHDLKRYAEGERKALFTLMPFEESVLTANTYDFALTSPPYFDVEKYDGPEQSWRRYKSFEAWCTGFYAPLISKTAAALKPGAHFALQIGNQSHPLEQTAQTIARLCGLQHVESRTTGMTNNLRNTGDEQGERVVIFRKQAGAVAPAVDPASAFGKVLL